MRIYAIYDKVAKEYSPAFCVKNDREAITTFKRVLGDTDFVREHELHCVGRFRTEWDNDQDGQDDYPIINDTYVVQLDYDAIEYAGRRSLFSDEEFEILKALIKQHRKYLDRGND